MFSVASVLKLLKHFIHSFNKTQKKITPLIDFNKDQKTGKKKHQLQHKEGKLQVKVKHLSKSWLIPLLWRWAYIILRLQISRWQIKKRKQKITTQSIHWLTNSLFYNHWWSHINWYFNSAERFNTCNTESCS